MAVNPELVGRVYPPSKPYLVEREKVREFSLAVGEAGPVHHDLDVSALRGFSGLVAPPTFAIVLSLQASRVAIDDPELGLDYARVVHGEQRFTYTRPIVSGDELVVTTTIESVRSMAGNDLVMTRGDVSTVSGEPVVVTHSLLVARAQETE